jgi:predicted ATP-grasp superfamily ATP-dependent carboligase
MRIFVYEHLSSGALAGQPGVESLRREGLAMLAAVLADLSRCPDVRPIALVEADLAGILGTNLPRAEIHAVASVPLRESGISINEDRFHRLARMADFTLVIAPEFDDLLEECCRWALDEGSRLLGPSPEAVRLTGDKLALAEHLRQQRVPTPLTAPCLDHEPPWPYPVVCKPRFGAGSQHTLLVQARGEYAAFRECLRAEMGSLREGIVQPLISGRAASVAFLAGSPGVGDCSIDWPRERRAAASAKPQAAERHERIALPACEQYLSDDGCFRYLGGKVPLDFVFQSRAHELARLAADAVDGLTGYFGIDLVLGESDDGSGDAVIEINPRLTTSYVGLRQLARGNLMLALLALADGRRPESLEWLDTPVRFHPDGRIE